MSEEHLSSYDDTDYDLLESAISQRSRKKSSEANPRSRNKKRSHRKRGGGATVTGMSHRRLHRWT